MFQLKGDHTPQPSWEGLGTGFRGTGEEGPYMCFVNLEKAFDRIPQGVLWGILWNYGVSGPLIWAVCSLYDWSQSLVRIAGSKSDSFPVRVGLYQSCPISPNLFITLMDRIPRHSHGVEGVRG